MSKSTQPTPAKNVRAGRPARSPAAEVPAKRKRRWLVVAGVLVILGMSAAGYWVYQSRGPLLPPVPEVDFKRVDPEVVDAITTARNGLLKNERSAQAWGELAMVLDCHGFTDQAIVCYKTAGNLDPGNALWPYLHGYLLKDTADREQALVLFRKAAANTERTDSPPRLRLAELLVDLNRFDETKKELELFQEGKPDNPFGLFILSQLAMARKDYPEALRLLQPLKDNPYFRVRSCRLRATVYSQLGDQAAAEQERTLLSKLPKEQVWHDESLEEVNKRRVGLSVHLSQGARLANQNKGSEAAAVFQKTTELYPQSHLAWAALGKQLARLDDSPGAEKALLKAVELKPDEPYYWHHLGLIRQSFGRKNIGQHRRAIDAFRKAIALSPTNADSRLKLGQSYEELGDYAAATDVYNEILLHHPEIDEARDALKRLQDRKK